MGLERPKNRTTLPHDDDDNPIDQSERRRRRQRKTALDGDDDDEERSTSALSAGADSASDDSSRRKRQGPGAYAHKVVDALQKNLHLELFGITWFDFAAISCSRWVFLFTLMGAAAGLATAVYLRLDNETFQDFSTEVR